MKLCGISTRTTLATEGLRDTTASPVRTSRATPSYSPSSTKSRAIHTEGRRDHEVIKLLWEVKTLCSMHCLHSVQVRRTFTDNLHLVSSGPGQAGPGWVYIWNAGQRLSAVCLGEQGTFKWYSWLCLVQSNMAFPIHNTVATSDRTLAFESWKI